MILDLRFQVFDFFKPKFYEPGFITPIIVPCVALLCFITICNNTYILYNAPTNKEQFTHILIVK